jgi:hypothetical protein
MQFFLLLLLVVNAATLLGYFRFRSARLHLSSRYLLPPHVPSPPLSVGWRPCVAKATFVMAVIYACMGVACGALFGLREVETVGFLALSAILAAAWIGWGRKYS